MIRYVNAALKRIDRVTATVSRPCVSFCSDYIMKRQEERSTAGQLKMYTGGLFTGGPATRPVRSDGVMITRNQAYLSAEVGVYVLSVPTGTEEGHEGEKDLSHW